MYLSKTDYDFLTRICDTLVCEHGSDDDFYYFCYMLMKMEKKQKEQNKKTAAFVAERCKTNKNYGRGYAVTIKSKEITIK